MMKLKNNFSLRKLLYNRKFTVSISIFIAFIFWLVITTNQNPVRQQSFSDIPISISLDNTVAAENGMDIITDISTQKFTVTVSGPNYVVSSLKTEDFTLYASVAEITKPGKYELEVFGTKNSAKGSYSFVSISPNKIEVELDYIDTKQFSVEPNLEGVGAVEGLVAESPIVTATEGDMISVTGARANMEKISRVIAFANVNEILDESKTYEAKVKLLDFEGKELNIADFTVSDSTVNVTVPILKKATVKVNASFINLPSGYSKSDIDYSIDHNSVTIIGTPDVVDTIKSITLSDIDFTSVSPESNMFEVSAVLPEGVKIVDNIEYFNVTVDMSNFAVKTFKSITGIKTNGLDSSLSVKKTASILNVKICAPKDIIDDIKAKDLYVSIDLSGKATGEHTVSAKISSDEYSGIWQVGSYTTTVTIS